VDDDDDVIDVRGSRFSLTAAEREVLHTIVDRDVIDVAEIGRALGTSDDGVYALLAGIAEKLDGFRALAVNRTPPLGISLSPLRKRRRRAALRAERQGSKR
jgi:DNA-binding CsgD family transcriptional regulator